LFILKTTQYTCNAPHRLSHKYNGFHILKHEGVLHSLTKTYKQSGTLFGVFNKHHELNYFSLNYQRGIAYGNDYSMHLHYPLVGYPINTLGSKTYLLELARILYSYTRKPILSLRYSVIKHHTSTLLEGYCSCSKLHNTPMIPLICYPITYFFKLGGVMHSLTNMG